MYILHAWYIGAQQETVKGSKRHTYYTTYLILRFTFEVRWLTSRESSVCIDVDSEFRLGRYYDQKRVVLAQPL